MKKKFFTIQEKAFVYKNSYKMTVNEMAQELNRSSRSIRAFLYNHKIDYKRSNMNFNSNLSKRESEVLKLMAQGLCDNEIAQKLFISTYTVKTHINNIITKLQFDGFPKHAIRVKAVLWYLKQNNMLS